jgi:hypothetical protein
MEDRRNRAILAALLRLRYPFDCELDHTSAKNSITGSLQWGRRLAVRPAARDIELVIPTSAATTTPVT